MSGRAAVIAALVATLSGPMAARADDTVRCGSRVITIGMSKSDVQDACGAPTSIEDIAQPVRAGKQVVGETMQSRWTYASNTVTRVFVFDQDRLVSIDTD